jgi:hypothetical protein
VPSVGTRISVRTSCGPSEVSKTPRKNSTAAMVRLPPRRLYDELRVERRQHGREV